MSILPRTRPAVKAAVIRFPVRGTALEHSIYNLMRYLRYSPTSVRETLDYLEAHGTAEGCESIEPDDAAVVTGMYADGTGHVESDPADWPAWTDRDVWTPNDDDAPPAPSPEPVDPSPQDRSWWAAERARMDREDIEWNAAHAGAVDALVNGLVPHDLPAPVCGGSPEARPVKVAPARRSRAIRGEYDDWDKANTGCV